MIDIGSLDRMITIQKATTSRDSFGAVLYEWEEFGTFNAKIDFKNASSKDANEIITSNQYVEFIIRNVGERQKQTNANGYRIAYPVDGTGAIILVETQYYNIVGVQEYGGRSKWKILQTELQTNSYKQP